ncbi:hypothetical protein DAPPUDRAFT_114655 [Daphnia pulex]|uniref:Uncharacterized protein n=1 Tax=Daphnia pulex TaxID=6669 RepID=E9HIV8_DAPPU|nr:hypothetical protein DAPPUDRAFT_114655 [Daphnia pulex]|eukprot:EFX68342.1 hypothetical protein DAPPUDRAFT_114655 [Daphnia pulex]
MAFIFLLGDVHEHVTLFRNIDGGSIGRVLPKCLSQWTSEKVKAQGVNVLPKANVEGAILEDCKVALTLNDGQKIPILVVIESIPSLKHDRTSGWAIAGENNTGKKTWMNNCSAPSPSAFFVVLSCRAVAVCRIVEGWVDHWCTHVSWENPSPYRQGGSPYGALPNRLALRQILGLATLRPHGMKTMRPNSAARAKELGEDKGVADNGLTNTNEHVLPTTNDDPR